uniref:Tim10-like domain-containing protein n=1 Tax=Panagrolaimus sp. JU765 TaxID=591449 RepID=A0AC34QF90_9BILA
MDQLLDIETLKKLTPEQQNQVIAGVKQQAAIVNAQNLITDLSEKCTSKCITAPGASLSGRSLRKMHKQMYYRSWSIFEWKLQDELGASSTISGSGFESTFS